MVSDNSKANEAQYASIQKARTSLELIRFNIAATASAIENTNRSLDAIEQRRLRSTQQENELVTEEFVAEELEVKDEQIQFERTQTVALIVAGILEVVEKNRFEGDKHTAYRDELDQLVLVRNSDGVQLMKASYNEKNSQWEQVEPSQLTTEEVQHFQQLIPKIQPELQHLEEEKSNESLNRQRGFSR